MWHDAKVARCQHWQQIEVQRRVRARIEKIVAVLTRRNVTLYERRRSVLLKRIRRQNVEPAQHQRARAVCEFGEAVVGRDVVEAATCEKVNRESNLLGGLCRIVDHMHCMLLDLCDGHVGTERDAKLLRNRCQRTQSRDTLRRVGVSVEIQQERFERVLSIRNKPFAVAHEIRHHARPRFIASIDSIQQFSLLKKGKRK